MQSHGQTYRFCDRKMKKCLSISFLTDGVPSRSVSMRGGFDIRIRLIFFLRDIFSPEGAILDSPGRRPGYEWQLFCSLIPRALPRAVVFRPFGAGQTTMHATRQYEKSQQTHYRDDWLIVYSITFERLLFGFYLFKGLVGEAFAEFFIAFLVVVKAIFFAVEVVGVDPFAERIGLGDFDLGFTNFFPVWRF